jgi:hypothetical protein
MYVTFPARQAYSVLTDKKADSRIASNFSSFIDPNKYVTFFTIALPLDLIPHQKFTVLYLQAGC